MSWEWSHTPDAYENARAHVRALDRADVECILSEWFAYDADGEDVALATFDRTNKRAHADVERLGIDWGHDAIWERAEGLRTCDNGGHAAWLCPWGCHTVPFAPPEDEERGAADRELRDRVRRGEIGIRMPYVADR